MPNAEPPTDAGWGLDLALHRQPLPPGAVFYKGSVADAAAVRAAFSAACARNDAASTSGTGGDCGGLDAVFHVAS
jgi:hypothetical protein